MLPTLRHQIVELLQASFGGMQTQPFAWMMSAALETEGTDSRATSPRDHRRTDRTRSVDTEETTIWYREIVERIDILSILRPHDALRRSDGKPRAGQQSTDLE